MKSVLERLTGVAGIDAAAVLDERGECLAFDGAGRALAIAMASREIVRGAMRSSTSRFSGDTRSLIARFDTCTLVVRRIEAGFLVVVGPPNLDMTTLGAAFPIAAAVKLVTMKMKRVMLEHARGLHTVEPAAVFRDEDEHEHEHEHEGAETQYDEPPAAEPVHDHRAPIESMVVPTLERSDDTLPSLDRAPGF